MDINDYQKTIREYIDYPLELGPFSVILDLQNNVGALSNKLNDALVKDHGNFTKVTKTKAIISLGDILNNICNIAYDLGFDMNDVIGMNITKHNMEVEKTLKANEQKNP
jgi:uncharacterized protein with PhoU and TrkA domain